MNREIWKSIEKLVSAPEDIYVELYRFLGEELGIPQKASKIDASDKDKEEYGKYMAAINDPKLAREKFREFIVPPSELACLSVLEGYYRVLSVFPSGVAEKYREKLRDYLVEHNLRYELTSDCRFEITIRGLIATQCAYLQKLVAGNKDREECLTDLEKSLSQLNNAGEEKNLIRIASNLLEGLASDKYPGNPTLGKAIEKSQDLFPHAVLKECVKNLYHFCCDYPNIRHAGTPASRLRNLRKDDALLMLALTMGFGLFIIDNNSSERILSGDLG